MRREWARSAADIVWRRTKLGLRTAEAEIAARDDYLTAALPGALAGAAPFAASG